MMCLGLLISVPRVRIAASLESETMSSLAAHLVFPRCYTNGPFFCATSLDSTWSILEERLQYLIARTIRTRVSPFQITRGLWPDAVHSVLIFSEYHVRTLACCKFTECCVVALSGKSSAAVEAAPTPTAVVTAEEIAKMEKKNELRLKIKEEHLAALQFEGSNWRELRW